MTAFGRSLPEQSVHRAIAMMVGAVVVLGLVILALMITEGAGVGTDRAEFARIVFEAHSAVMFIGRVGPLSLAAAMTASCASSNIAIVAVQDAVIEKLTRYRSAKELNACMS